jgi:O-antigen/teichoic acid export membrane protein
LGRSQLFSAGSNWLAFAATLAVSFFLTPYLIRSLGPARYDVWCSVEAVLAYFTLLDLGVAVCLVRYVAKHHEMAELQHLNRMASTSMAVFLVAGAVAFFLGLIVFSALAQPLINRTGHPEDVLPFLALMLLNLAVSLPLSVFPAILDGLERFPEKSLVRLVSLTLRTIAIVVLLQQTPSLMLLALIFTASTIVENALFAWLSWRHLPGLRFSLSLVNRETWHQVRTFSSDAFLAMLAGRITLQTGAIVAGVFLPTGAATVFVTASRLVEYAKTLLRNITTTLTPGISAREARGDWHGIRMVFLTATRWVLYLVLPINLGLAFFGWPFLARWVGVEFALPAYPLVVILSLTLSLSVAQSVASRLLYGLGRLKLFARFALIEAALNIGLLVALLWPLGLAGVAWSVTIPHGLFCLVILRHTLNCIELPASTYLRDAIRLPVLASVFPAIVWVVLPTAEANWFSIGCSISMGLIPYSLVVGFVEFGHRLRRPSWSTPSNRRESQPIPAQS